MFLDAILSEHTKSRNFSRLPKYEAIVPAAIVFFSSLGYAHTPDCITVIFDEAFDGVTIWLQCLKKPPHLGRMVDPVLAFNDSSVR